MVNDNQSHHHDTECDGQGVQLFIRDHLLLALYWVRHRLAIVTHVCLEKLLFIKLSS